jgi:hypothetical protein
MRVEIIADKMPTRRSGVSGDHRLHMRQEISFSAGRSGVRSNHLACRYVTTKHERERTMTGVLELTPFHFTRAPSAILDGWIPMLASRSTRLCLSCARLARVALVHLDILDTRLPPSRQNLGRRLGSASSGCGAVEGPPF